MKKYITLLSLLGVFLNGYGQHDSTWPKISWEPVITKDTIGKIPFEYWQQYHDIDSSEWRLMEIKDGRYKYYKIIGYGIVESIRYDSVRYKELPDEFYKKIDPFLLWPGGIDYLVGHMERKYLWTNRLLEGCEISDTIPTPIIGYGDGYKIREWRVGGWMGELVRADTLEKQKPISKLNKKALK